MKIGVDTDLLYADNNDGLKALYYFVSANRAISFDFYDNTLMRTMNTIVVKDRVAIICALDQYNRVNVASVIIDPEKVNQIYVRTLPASVHRIFWLMPQNSLNSTSTVIVQTFIPRTTSSSC